MRLSRPMSPTSAMARAPRRYLVSPEQSFRALFHAVLLAEEVVCICKIRDNAGSFSCKFSRGLDGSEDTDSPERRFVPSAARTDQLEASDRAVGEQINWQRIEAVCASSFTSGRGRPATSPRLIAGLLYLQHAFDLSDEQVVWGWVENPYWQVFTGETYLQTEPPIDPSSLTRWRQRLGEAGIEELLAATVAAARWRAVAHGQPQDGDCGHDGRAQGSGASDGLALARTQSPALGQGCCRARLEAAAELEP